MTVPRMALAAACCWIIAAGPAAAADPTGSAKRGAEVSARWCSECHATGASSRASDVGPPFSKIARERSADYLRGFLANPHVRGQMPPFNLTRERIEDLVAYLQSLR